MKRTIYILLALLLLTLACAVPGIGGQSAPVIPTSVPGELETAIAGTASAAAAMTSAAASPTPSPTITLTPTITPKVFEGADSTLIKNQDGSTKYIDKVAGYSITIPAGWLAFRIGQQEYYDAWSAPSMMEANRQKFLTTLQTKDPKFFRLSALDVRKEHETDAFVTSLLFSWLQDENVSLDSDEDIKRMSNETSGWEGVKTHLLSTSVSTLSSGIKVGIIEWEMTQEVTAGKSVTIYQRFAILPRKTGGTTAFLLSTTNELKDVLLLEFNAMLETLTIP